MKNKSEAMRRTFFILIFAVFTTASLALPVWAAPNFITSDKDQAVTVDAALADDTYIGANTAIVNADIDGDLVMGANTAQLNGKVGGDLWVGANTVTVNNRITGDVRIGAGEVIINTIVDDDVIVGTGNLTIGEKAVIKGDLIVGSGQAVVNGKIYGNVRIAGGSVTLKANVNGNVEVRTDRAFTILPGTKIGGELSYWAPTENLEFIKYAKTVTYHPVAKRLSMPLIGAFMWIVPAITISFLLWKLFGLLLLGAVVIWLMPKFLPRIVVMVKKDYWKALWQGLVFMFGVPLLMLVLAMTLVGAYMAIATGLLYLLVLIFGYSVTVIMIGSWFIKKFDRTIGRQVGAFAIGSIVFGILALIPVIGWLVGFILMMMGIGGFWQDRYKMFRAGKY